jgi:hypothetical protein
MYYEYAKQLGANEEVLNWISRTLSTYLKKPNDSSQEEIEHVLDYLISDAAPQKLIRMSYPQAKVGAFQWMISQQKKGRGVEEKPSDIEVVHKFDDGASIVKLLGEAAFKREGFLMSHCVHSYFGRKDCWVYSYRDQKNNPHVTLEVINSGKEIQQIKGKGNGSIHPKYIHPILWFLKSIGFSVRSSEMKNLGYYYLDEEMIKLAKEFCEFETETIDGKDYVFTW